MLSACVRCGNPIFVSTDQTTDAPPAVHRSCSCFSAPLTPRELHPSSLPSVVDYGKIFKFIDPSKPTWTVNRTEDSTSRPETGIGSTNVADYGDLIQMPREQFKFIKASRPTTTVEEFLQWGSTMPLTVEYPSSTDEAADL